MTPAYKVLRVPALHFMILWTQNVVEFTGIFANETLLDQDFRAKGPFGGDGDDIRRTCLCNTTGTPTYSVNELHLLDLDRPLHLSGHFLKLRNRVWLLFFKQPHVQPLQGEKTVALLHTRMTGPVVKRSGGRAATAIIVVMCDNRIPTFTTSLRSLCAHASFPPCQPQSPINRQKHSKLHPSKRLRQTATPRIRWMRPYRMQASCCTAHLISLMRSASLRLQNVTSSTRHRSQWSFWVTPAKTCPQVVA